MANLFNAIHQIKRYIYILFSNSAKRCRTNRRTLITASSLMVRYHRYTKWIYASLCSSLYKV